MRTIKQMIRAMMTVLFHSEAETSEAAQELFQLADDGRIDEAENRLSDLLDGEDMEMLYTALLFYDHINDYSNRYLEEHGFSREEIVDGVRNAAGIYGRESLVDTLMTT